MGPPMAALWAEDDNEEKKVVEQPRRLCERGEKKTRRGHLVDDDDLFIKFAQAPSTSSTLRAC